MNNQKNNWEESYKRKDNFVFFPHEEIIRFFAKYISQKTGLTSIKKRHNLTEAPRILDLGCGIGRHVIFSHQMQCESYGIDLTHSAIEVALEWGKKENIPEPEKRILQGDITNMPFEDCFFDFILSHGVIDSMSLANAKKAVLEAARVIKKEGLFYCDVVSGNDSYHSTNFYGEEIVESEHEKGTIQLYFNDSLIKEVFEQHFKIEEIILIKRSSLQINTFTSRFHLILKKK
jgi:ubiquinone/menaquinone biosynthesis C-methylase UbiE